MSAQHSRRLAGQGLLLIDWCFYEGSQCSISLSILPVLGVGGDKDAYLSHRKVNP